jgi:hypothetical protein
MSGSNTSEKSSGRVVIPVLLAAYTFSPFIVQPFLRESAYSIRIIYFCSFLIPAVYFLAGTVVCFSRRAWLDAVGSAVFGCWSVAILPVAGRALSL